MDGRNDAAIAAALEAMAQALEHQRRRECCISQFGYFPERESACLQGIYEEDNNAYYKVVSERIGKHQQNCGKPYDAPAGKGKQKAAQGQRTSGGDAPASIVCFKCGKPGHKSNMCIAEVRMCFRCGKFGHEIADCKHKEVICFNCNEEGHISTQCQKPKREQLGGKVLALAGTQTTNEDRLIRGTSFINSIPLITIIDIGATHCFIAADCVKKLNL
ncbi:uncharacterized protein LOC131651257 [Vicia villosa]|uniref:uncharacterized protein LOC131651257 n=1 Tax=Vicia villosa TaxID=3911 RepID=UPI00273C6A69|nr:uncharacterized protein LOC131651257 [Vicia villosa]